ncbi:hypothetical protein ABVT39_012800 [Epinephelus coioides]
MRGLMGWKADGLEKLIKENAENIDALKESSEFLFKEIQDVKTDVTEMKTTVTSHEKRVSELEDRVNEAECYQRRWNMRLYGLKEQEGEDVKRQVIEICHAIIPEIRDSLCFHINISHRIGDKIRTVLTQFTSRSTKELVWKKAKGSEYLMSRKLRSGEDLMVKDREIRNRLWPQTEAARKEEKKSFFVGVSAIIDGKELRA